MVRQRHPPVSKPKPTTTEPSAPVPGKMTAAEQPADASWTARNRWMVLALASGGCAAFNGVFAKLTTTDLTSRLSDGIANLFGLSAYESIVEVVVRCIFFGLNLIFNGIMWSLFTAALSRGNSTTQVSIMNTSSNFVLTALLGFFIFSESLPPLWWLGAGMLVAGNVIVGRKDEGKEEEAGVGEESALLREGEDDEGVKEDEEDGDVADLGDEESGSDEM